MDSADGCNCGARGAATVDIAERRKRRHPRAAKAAEGTAVAVVRLAHGSGDVEGARTSLEVLVYQGLLEGLLEGLHHGAQGRFVGTVDHRAVTGGARATVSVAAVRSVAHHRGHGRGIDRPDENDQGCHIRRPRHHLEESLGRNHESISNLPSKRNESTKSKRRKERSTRKRRQ